MAALGLTTYRLNNNLKSTALLVLFPDMLLALQGVVFFALGLLSGRGNIPTGAFGFSPVLGTGSPLDLALSAIAAWWPIVLGIAAIWVTIGYFFNEWIIHNATGAVAADAHQEPEL